MEDIGNNIPQRDTSHLETQSQEDNREYSLLAVLGFIFAFLFPVAGLILSIMGLNETKKKNLKGRTLAIWGIVLSSLALVILPVIIAIGSIAYFGVLDTGNLLPERCSIPAHECEIVASASQTNLRLVDYSRSIGAMNTFKISGENNYDCLAEPQLYSNNVLNVICPNIRAGSYDIEYTYTRVGTSIESKGTGSLYIN